MGEVAVPQSTVASQPALQWVSTLTGSPFLRAAMSRMISSPWTPIMRLISTSSSTISAARRQAAASRSPSGRGLSTRIISSSAQRRLTAVGRVACRCP